MDVTLSVPSWLLAIAHNPVIIKVLTNLIFTFVVILGGLVWGWLVSKVLYVAFKLMKFNVEDEEGIRMVCFIFSVFPYIAVVAIACK